MYCHLFYGSQCIFYKVVRAHLFAIYPDDPAALCRPECKLFIILYADDILLLAPTLTALQKLLLVCENELYLIDMAINFYDVVCANIASCYGRTIQWEKRN